MLTTDNVSLSLRPRSSSGRLVGGSTRPGMAIIWRTAVIIAIALLNTLITDVDAQESGGDACEIVDKALRIDELQGYYHIDVLSNRKPLRMLGNDFVNEGCNHTIFGEPVLYVVDDPHFVLDMISVSGNTAILMFRYLPEGLRGKLLIRKELHWRVIKSTITEE